MRRLLLCSVLVLAGSLTVTSALAQPTGTADNTISERVVGPPVPGGIGVNAGFGGQLGFNPAAMAPVQIFFDTDVLGRTSILMGQAACGAVGPPPGNYDVIVLYIDTDPGGPNGFPDTTAFADVTTPEAAAVSGLGFAVPAAAAPLFFPPGFLADYAIAFTNPGAIVGPAAFLFQLNAGVPHGVTPLAFAPLGGCGIVQITGLTLAMIGVPQGAPFHWLGTLINANAAFRSNEFQGAFPAPIPNIGVAPHVMGPGELNLFNTVGRVLINEVDADTPSSPDFDEFVELIGPPGLLLDGATIVGFDGTSGQSVLAVDLDGTTLDGAGYILAGNASVPGVNGSLIWTDDLLENGEDAAALYLDDATTFAPGTPATATNLVDALVYETGSDPDTSLPGILAPGVIDEAALGDASAVSNQRCPDGSGMPRMTGTYGQGAPTPGMPNMCTTCGDGTLDPGEQCDDGAANGSSSSCCRANCRRRPRGRECGPAGSAPCDAPDVCDDAGNCVATVAEAGVECRPSGGDACDPAEVCDGSSTACPADMMLGDGEPCPDSIVCNGDEVCQSGACMSATPLSCDDGNACTTETCREPGGCDFAMIPGCCNIDADCDDGDSCTIDSCSGPGGTCSASEITGCCAADADCDTGNPCWADTCDLATNTCEAVPVPGCCAGAGDCDDGNGCTTDMCDVATGTCTSDEVADCCLTAGDCNDDDTCTVDMCVSASMMCTNEALAGCCSADAMCDDGDECTTDSCDLALARCTSDPILGCVLDGGPADGGPADGGPADGGPRLDSGSGSDGSMSGDTGEEETAGGCGCRIVAPRSTSSALWIAGALLSWFVRRRERR